MKLSKFEDGEKEGLTLFKSLMGSLKYLSCTIFDILYAIGVVSRFMKTPTYSHFTHESCQEDTLLLKRHT